MDRYVAAASRVITVFKTIVRLADEHMYVVPVVRQNLSQLQYATHTIIH